MRSPTATGPVGRAAWLDRQRWVLGPHQHRLDRLADRHFVRRNRHLLAITPGSQLGVACELRQTVTRAQTFTTWSAVHKAGVNTTRRRWGAYCFAGNCDWGGDGTRGLISTCLDAHPKASYAFRLPRWSAIRGYGKVVSGSVK